LNEKGLLVFEEEKEKEEEEEQVAEESKITEEPVTDELNPAKETSGE
jgi:hypothetical protein